MTKPSRIVKSAYRKAMKAGFTGSLKEFAAAIVQPHGPQSACEQWQRNKAQQRREGSK